MHEYRESRRSGRRTKRAHSRVLRRFAEDHDDAGITMIECIIALVIISTVLLAGVLEINVALTTSNQQRYRIEATNLAVATLEQVQQEAAAGTINPVQTTYPPQNVASQTFFVSTQYTVEQQNNGLVTSICTSTLSTDSSEIWQVSATVTWNGMQGQQPLTETTEVAPGAASAQQLADGELAIEVVGLTGTPLTTPVNFSVTPVAVGGGETVYPGAPIPSGLNTGNDGCGIVTDLSTDPDWNYVVTLTQNTGWVSAGELSDANSDPATATLSVSAGQVSRLSTPFQVAHGRVDQVRLPMRACRSLSRTRRFRTGSTRSGADHRRCLRSCSTRSPTATRCSPATCPKATPVMSR